MKIIRLAQEAVLENSEEAEKYALENIDSVQEAFEKKEEGDSSSYNYYLEEIEEYERIFRMSESCEREQIAKIIDERVTNRKTPMKIVSHEEMMALIEKRHL